MAGLVFGWGCALLGMGFSKSYASLCATRFLLGLFEGASSPPEETMSSIVLIQPFFLTVSRMPPSLRHDHFPVVQEARAAFASCYLVRVAKLAFP